MTIACACLPTEPPSCPSTALMVSLVALSPPLSFTTSYALKAWAFLAFGLMLRCSIFHVNANRPCESGPGKITFLFRWSDLQRLTQSDHKTCGAAALKAAHSKGNLRRSAAFLRYAGVCVLAFLCCCLFLTRPVTELPCYSPL